MKLLLVRHGETEENRLGIIQGHRPGVLTPAGRAQAQCLGHCLKAERIDHIYCSDLDRARATVAAIAPHHSVTVQFERELRERSLGVYEGRLRTDYRSDYQRSGVTLSEFRPERGESLADVKLRSEAYLRNLRRRHDEETILLCTHGGVIVCMLSILLDIPLEEMLLNPIHNCSLSVFEWPARRSAYPLLLNSTAHLRGVPATTASADLERAG